MNRAGGAPTLAVGIASRVPQSAAMAEHGLLVSLRYSVRSPVILTALDAGTRSGRFMLQACWVTSSRS
ncbi:carbon starvation CstA family protein [Escherichia coli]